MVNKAGMFLSHVAARSNVDPDRAVAGSSSVYLQLWWGWTVFYDPRVIKYLLPFLLFQTSALARHFSENNPYSRKKM